MLLSFWDPSFQLVDTRLQKRILDSLPTLLTMIRNTPTDDIVQRLLLVWFHINYQTEMGAQIVAYVTDVVYLYIFTTFSFLKTTERYPYLSLFITADDVEQMASGPMPDGLLDMSPIVVPQQQPERTNKWISRYVAGDGDVLRGYRLIKETFDNESDYDSELEQQGELLEDLFGDSGDSGSSTPVAAAAASAEVSASPKSSDDPFELLGKKKCVHCKKMKKLIPTIHLGKLQRVGVCTYCAQKGFRM